MSIFEHRTDHLISALQMNKVSDNEDVPKIYEILELGAGDGTKTYHLLKRLLDLDVQFEYHPGDISQNALDMLEEKLISNLPSLKIRKHQGQYIDIMKKFKESNQSMANSKSENGAKRETIVLVLGSNIGNMPEMVSHV
jgi:L-histidine N-alpha-methyltransferase